MRIRPVAACAALSFFACSPVGAQTVPAEAAETMVVSDTVLVPIWPMTAVQLPEQPVAAAFALGSIEGVAPALLSGVTAKGYARKVAVEDQTIGQVLVVSVSKNGREELISTEGLAAQFDAGETSQLFPERTLEVQGSKAALVAALERLAAPKKDDEEKEVARDPVSDNPVSPGGKSSNDEAASYRTPDIAPYQPGEDPPVVDHRLTLDGCPVRIDLAQGRAFRQSKEQTFTDGALTSEGACSDSQVSFPLKRSYLACPVDIVDLAAMKAWPQFSLYYIDDAGETRTVGECTTDEESAYVITEDESQCSVFMDFAARQAVPQAAMMYTNRNNAPVQARGCDISSKSAPLPMTESIANCSLRHDFAAGRSAELSMWTYIRGGITYQAAPCADTGRTFPHDTIYADAGGNNICPPITNLDAKTVTLQSRKRITIDGVSQYITECTPDTSTRAITATTEGCSDPSKWTHDLDAGISYGQERFYYPKTNGQREYVTPCQNSAATYPHSVTVTGYQHNDAELWSYPLTTVRITIGGSPYTIASSTVLPGAAQWAYVPDGTVDQPTGHSSYEACNAYRETARYERWKRPDETEYLKFVSAGTPQGPVDVCISTVVASQNLYTGSSQDAVYTTESGDSMYVNQRRYLWYQTVNKSERKNSETGEIVATTCGFANNASWMGWSTSTLVTAYCGPLWQGESSCRQGWSVGWPQMSSQSLFVPPCPF